jgi:DNA-binding CsgD family transcriptional regulator
MNFKKIFVANYPDYVNKVLTKAPNLTQSEIRVCMYVKMNLSNKEILEKDHISPSTLNNMRHSIRKKMKLKREDNLVLTLLKV